MKKLSSRQTVCFRKRRRVIRRLIRFQVVCIIIGLWSRSEEYELNGTSSDDDYARNAIVAIAKQSRNSNAFGNKVNDEGSNC